MLYETWVDVMPLHVNIADALPPGGYLHSMTQRFNVAIVTVSDRCSDGSADDVSGPTAERLLREHAKFGPLLRSVTRRIVPDDIRLIQGIVSGLVGGHQLIVLTGGTGFGVRDRTPEAIEPLLTKKAPGLVHMMLSAGLQSTPFAWMSRPVAGVIVPEGSDRGVIVVTLPGSPNAVTECLTPLLNHGLEHALALATEEAAPKLRHTDPAASAPLPPPSDALLQHPRETTTAKPPSGAPKGGISTTTAGTSAPTTASVADRQRKSTYPMVPMQQALELIVAAAKAAPKNVEEKRVEEAEGCILAADIFNQLPQPPFRASIKDGYAVIAADGPGEYPVLGTITAGMAGITLTTPPPTAPSKAGKKGATAAAPPSVVSSLSSGFVCRVNTGGMVPDGADAVVQVEDTELVRTTQSGKEEASIRILKQAKPGTDIRPVACDVAVGQLVLRAGDVIGPTEIALLATMGRCTVSVIRKPVIGVMSTGDELCDPYGVTAAADGSLPVGCIFDSNKAMLCHAAKPYGASVVDCGIAKDNLVDTKERFRKALFDLNVDVLFTSGGVSMGEVDCVKAILLELGATIHFGRVNMKPGKPATFATVRIPTSASGSAPTAPPVDAAGKGKKGKNASKAAATPVVDASAPTFRTVFVFGLPGNPVSAWVCFHVFAVPALRCLAAIHEEAPSPLVAISQYSHPVVRATIGDRNGVALDGERPEYQRCWVVSDTAALSTSFTVYSTGSQASHRLLSTYHANGLMILPAKKATPAADEPKTEAVDDVVGNAIFSALMAKEAPPQEAAAGTSVDCCRTEGAVLSCGEPVSVMLIGPILMMRPLASDAAVATSLLPFAA